MILPYYHVECVYYTSPYWWVYYTNRIFHIGTTTSISTMSPWWSCVSDNQHLPYLSKVSHQLSRLEKHCLINTVSRSLVLQFTTETISIGIPYKWCYMGDISFWPSLWEWLSNLPCFLSLNLSLHLFLYTL